MNAVRTQGLGCRVWTAGWMALVLMGAVSAAPATPSRPVAAGICGADAVVYACRLADNQDQVAICARGSSADPKALYAVSQSQGGPRQVAAPDQPGVALRRSFLGYARTGGYAFTILQPHAPHAVFYSMSDAGGEGGGIVVVNDEGRAESTRSCQKGSIVETEDDQLIRASLALPSDPDLTHGLPAPEAPSSPKR